MTRRTGGENRRADKTGRTGRRPGSSDTRAQILEEARTLFAERGYRSTSVRAIASAAGVDAALVHHYFGTKEGLFRASLEIPIDPRELLASVAAGPPEEMPLRLAEEFLALWDSPGTGPAMAGFARRILAEPTASGEFSGFLDESVIRAGSAALLPGVAPDEAARRLTLTMTHLVGLLVGRRLLGVEPLASWPADDLARTVAPTLDRYLRGDLTDSQNPPTTRGAHHDH